MGQKNMIWSRDQKNTKKIPKITKKYQKKIPGKNTKNYIVLLNDIFTHIFWRKKWIFSLLFTVLPVLVESVEGTLVNMADVEQQNKLCENSRLLGDKVKMIKSALKRPAGVTIGLSCFQLLLKAFAFLPLWRRIVDYVCLLTVTAWKM